MGPSAHSCTSMHVHAIASCDCWHMYTRVYMQICTCITICLSVRVCVCTHVSVHVCIYMLTCVCGHLHACANLHTSPCEHECTQMRMHVLIHTYPETHKCMCASPCTCVHMHVHMRVRPSRPCGPGQMFPVTHDGCAGGRPSPGPSPRPPLPPPPAGLPTCRGECLHPGTLCPGSRPAPGPRGSCGCSAGNLAPHSPTTPSAPAAQPFPHPLLRSLVLSASAALHPIPC